MNKRVRSAASKTYCPIRKVGPQVVKTEPGHLELAREDPLTSQKPTPPSPIHGPDHSAYPLLNASAPEFQPGTINTMAAGTPVNPQQPSNSLANDLTKFLLKKDLLMTRLSFFTDHPESYAVWKNSFQGIVEELGCTPLEELDLLVKWLGPESKKYAMSIRTSNASCPHRGLQRLWERLDERYGCPEMVEADLKKKLATSQNSQRKTPNAYMTWLTFCQKLNRPWKTLCMSPFSHIITRHLASIPLWPSFPISSMKNGLIGLFATKINTRCLFPHLLSLHSL